MSPEEAPGRTDYRALAARMGYASLRRRLKRQARYWFWKSLFPKDRFFMALLKASGFQARALANSLDFQIVRNMLPIPNLPPTFEGFTILQLSDLHCDLHPEFTDRLVDKLKGLACDLAAFTGDYHNKIQEPPDDSLRRMERIVQAVPPPRLAVLGNHDFIEQVAFLEDIGLPTLLNESVALERHGEKLWFAGVDDPHLFRSDDLVRASARIPGGAPAILLSHSPGVYREAARMGFSALLCGHTHGGQVCLPGGIPILSNVRVPRRMISGPWKYHSLTGYTSRGTGASGVPARFWCPPEITLHTLTHSPG